MNQGAPSQQSIFGNSFYNNQQAAMFYSNSIKSGKTLYNSKVSQANAPQNNNSNSSYNGQSL